MPIRKYKNKATAYKAKLRNINAHNRETYTSIAIRFFKDRDKDILDYLATITKKADYFRKLLREEIAKKENSL